MTSWIGCFANPYLDNKQLRDKAVDKVVGYYRPVQAGLCTLEEAEAMSMGDLQIINSVAERIEGEKADMLMNKIYKLISGKG